MQKYTTPEIIERVPAALRGAFAKLREQVADLGGQNGSCTIGFLRQGEAMLPGEPQPTLTLTLQEEATTEE